MGIHFLKCLESNTVCFECIVFYSPGCMVLFPVQWLFLCQTNKRGPCLFKGLLYDQLGFLFRSLPGSCISLYLYKHGFLHFILIIQLFQIILNINNSPEKYSAKLVILQSHRIVVTELPMGLLLPLPSCSSGWSSGNASRFFKETEWVNTF